MACPSDKSSKKERKPSILECGLDTQTRKEASVNKFTHLLQSVFDEKETAEKAKPIIEGILKARSPRLSDIAREMKGKEDWNYKYIQRFLEKTKPQESLLRLFQENASFVIGDPTEMPRPQAKKTDYIGTLSDGQTMAFGLEKPCEIPSSLKIVANKNFVPVCLYFSNSSLILPLPVFSVLPPWRYLLSNPA